MNLTAKRAFGKVFEFGADFYAWVTAQGVWEANCKAMAARVPAGARCVVDLGCGPGVSAFVLARSLPSARVLGLDMAARMLQQARARQEKSGVADRVGWIRGDAHGLPLKAHSVDAMTGHSFLYLVPEPDRALAEILRCLKPGGRLVLMEPRRGGAPLKEILKAGLDPRFLLSMSLWRPVSVMHGQFSEEGLTAKLTGAGFTQVRMEHTLGGLGLLASATKAFEAGR